MCSKLLQQLCAVKACVATIPAARNQPNSNALWLLCCWRNWAFWKMKQIEPLIYIRKFFNKTLGSHTPRPSTKPPCVSFRKSVHIWYLFWGYFGVCSRGLSWTKFLDLKLCSCSEDENRWQGFPVQPKFFRPSNPTKKLEKSENSRRI